MSKKLIVTIERKEKKAIKYIKDYLLYREVEHQLSLDRVRAIFRLASGNIVVHKEVIAEVILFFYKYKELEKQLDKCVLKNMSFYSYVGALLSVDFVQEKGQLVEQISALGDKISIDGFFNFCEHNLRENWQSLAQLAYKLYSQCRNDADAYELTSFILSVDSDNESESVIVVDNENTTRLIKNRQPIPIINIFNKEDFNIITTILSHRPTNIIVVNPGRVGPELMRAINFLGE